MTKAKIINSWEVKPFILDASYTSRMLMDDTVVGTHTIHINEGTLKAGFNTGGGKHEVDEIYYVVKGEAVVHLDEESFDIKPGSLVFIPAGTFHSLDNKSNTEEFVLLTFWQRAEDNEVWQMRKKAWGKTFKTIDED
jgi:mannose-6-phosphate isomerase-like protein (cupin superfamily)